MPALPPDIPDIKPGPHPDEEGLVFPVRRYRPPGAEDAEIVFEPIPVEALAEHPLFVAVVMTKKMRRWILEQVGTTGRTHVIWADRVPVGVHAVMSPAGLADVTSLTLAGAKYPTWCRALSLFEGGEYRLDMDASRERALIRMLEVLGIPEFPEPPHLDDEAALGTLAP